MLPTKDIPQHSHEGCFCFPWPIQQIWLPEYYGHWIYKNTSRAKTKQKLKHILFISDVTHDTFQAAYQTPSCQTAACLPWLSKCFKTAVSIATLFFFRQRRVSPVCKLEVRSIALTISYRLAQQFKGFHVCNDSIFGEAQSFTLEQQFASKDSIIFCKSRELYRHIGKRLQGFNMRHYVPLLARRLHSRNGYAKPLSCMSIL